VTFFSFLQSHARGLHRLALIVVLVLLSSRGTALAASDMAEFEKARAAYVSRNYEDCESRLRTLLDPDNPRIKDPVLLSQARMYYGAALVQRGKNPEAGKTFEALLLGDPQYDPDPLTFSGPVLEVFYDTRQQLRERLAAKAQEDARKAAEKRAHEEEMKRKEEARVRRLMELATEEHITSRNSRFVASLPFGVGQFQNRQPILGAVLLGTEAALVLGTVLMIPLRADADSSANAELLRGNAKRADDYHTRALTITYANWAFAGAFAFTAAVGILQAHISFVPEFRERRTRPLPPLGQWSPYAAPIARGGQVGLTGTF
jgi:tetratricopeptide (TPR) repeat protein